MMECRLIVISAILLIMFAFFAGWIAARSEYLPRRDARGRFVR